MIKISIDAIFHFSREESPDKARARQKHYKRELEGSDSDSDPRSHSKAKKEKIRSIVSKKKTPHPESGSDSSDSWEQERPQSDRPGTVSSCQQERGGITKGCGHKKGWGHKSVGIECFFSPIHSELCIVLKQLPYTLSTSNETEGSR